MAGFFENLTTFLLCSEGLELVDINSGHQPAKFWLGKIADFRLLPGPLTATGNRQAFTDQYITIRFTEQRFEPIPSSSTEKEENCHTLHGHFNRM